MMKGSSKKTSGRTTFHSGRTNVDAAAAGEGFLSGVSLHGHTWYSHENLGFLPGVIGKVRALPRLFRWAEKKYERKWNVPFDYSRGYWTSPVPPVVAHTLEARQISGIGLNPLVSLTDHDSIFAHRELSPSVPDLPISLEWTAPYRKGAVFHIGVHNLPAGSAEGIVAALGDYYARPSDAVLGSLLSDLHSLPDTLVVMNHPLSDQGRIGFEIHVSVVHEFLKQHAGKIHALEANALQPDDMNSRTAAIAEEFGLPVVAGGDRHGFEPNGAVNLTKALNFTDFVHELREERASNVLFMPQYYRSLRLRYAENVRAIMRSYPILVGRTTWHDRVFYECPDGVTRSLSEMVGRRKAALGAMKVAVGALGIANQLARPISDFER